MPTGARAIAARTRSSRGIAARFDGGFRTREITWSTRGMRMLGDANCNAAPPLIRLPMPLARSLAQGRLFSPHAGRRMSIGTLSFERPFAPPRGGEGARRADEGEPANRLFAEAFPRDRHPVFARAGPRTPPRRRPVRSPRPGWR